MSNLRTRLKKIASTMNVNEDAALSGLTQKIIGSLEIKISPVSADGHLGEFEGELTIAMSNGDKITLDYESSPDGSKTQSVLEINGTELSVSDDFDPSGIGRMYNDFINKKV